jgi:hypothetical protein
MTNETVSTHLHIVNYDVRQATANADWLYARSSNPSEFLPQN